MHAKIEYNAGMKQYTIRKVPDYVDKAARREAEKTKKSLNSVLLDALEKGLSVHENRPIYCDMDDLVGTWVSDPETAAAFAEFDTIDEDLWK